MMLGGRVAEELVFDDPGSGAGEDLAAVNALARRMVCELGMSPALSDRTYPSEHHYEAPRHSEDEARLIGAEMRRLTDEAHGLARAAAQPFAPGPGSRCGRPPGTRDPHR